MADRMRVTSFIGDTRKVNAPRNGPSLPSSGVGNLCPAYASHLLTRQVLPAIEEVIGEYISRLAPNPELLRHADDHRALTRPALQRRRAAPHPPVRSAYQPDPGLCR